jgi:hypothetical protein
MIVSGIGERFVAKFFLFLTMPGVYSNKAITVCSSKMINQKISEKV